MQLFNPFQSRMLFREPAWLTGQPYWQEHIPFAMWLVESLRPRVLVELGTHWGDSYCAFCQAVAELELETRCYAVDTWAGDIHTGEYGPEVLAQLRAHHDVRYGSFSTLVQRRFEDALQQFGDGTIDLLHMDGTHTYEAVKRDYESWLPKMSALGVILLHDTNVVGQPEKEVRRLFDEVKVRHRHFEFLHSYGLGVLIVGGEVPEAVSELSQVAGAELARVREYFTQQGRRIRQGRELLEARGRGEAAEVELKGRVAAAEANVRELSASLMERASEIERLQESLNTITGSRGWAMLQLLWRARRKLAPEQSVLGQRLKRHVSPPEKGENSSVPGGGNDPVPPPPDQALIVMQKVKHGVAKGLEQESHQAARLNREVWDLKWHLTEREQRLAAKEQRIAGLSAAVVERDQLIAHLDRSLSEITSSRGWALLQRAWSIKRMLKGGATASRQANANSHGNQDDSPSAVSEAAAEAQGLNGNASTLTPEITELIELSATPKPPKREALVRLSPEQVRLIAFYLPQFHPIPENDKWWGKGFTEWANVIKAKPNFEGHYQPHLPADLGFYDLRVPETRQQQAELASEYGIYGFCYYYYWFGGQRLLERPFDEVLSSGQPDFPFCICWANENWTRRWDGEDNEVLIAQQHSDEDDRNFIRSLFPAFCDRRYIRVNGKPLLLVYRAGILPDSAKTAAIWREECHRAGMGEIYLCAMQSFGLKDRPYGFDAAVEFPPGGAFAGDITGQITTFNPQYAGEIHDYVEVVRYMIGKPPTDYTLFRGVMPSWDNTPRRPNHSNLYWNSSPDAYGQWLNKIVELTLRRNQGDERLVFINAWNEWGEGAHLEPDQKYGRGFLEATQNALFVEPQLLIEAVIE